MRNDLRLGWTTDEAAQQQLRPLDLAFARFLAGEDDAATTEWLLLAALLSKQLADGHLCMDLNQWTRLADEQAWPSPWREAVARAVMQPGPAWVSGGDGSTPIVRDGHRLYLRRYWEHERSIAAAIQTRLHAPDITPERLAAALAAVFPNDTSPDWSRVAAAVACCGGFTVITGGPGTGKTTTVVRLLAVLQSLHLAEHEQPLRIRLAAPTGKAAARLTASIDGQRARLPVSDAVRASIPSHVETLHRLLGARPDTRQFANGQHRPLALDVLVIDEASMVDLEMMASVFAALPPTARLILLGDKDQLSSVEAGAVLGDVCQRAEAGHYSDETAAWLASVTGDDIAAWVCDDARPLDQHVVMLRHSHRFGADSGIGRLAQAVNAGDATAANALLRLQLDDLRWVDHGCDNATLRELVLPTHDVDGGYRGYLHRLRTQRPAQGASFETHQAWARDVLHAFGRFQLLCAVRQGDEGTEGLNRRVAELLQREGLIDASHLWYEGRPVLVTRNDYALGLMNGDIGMALQVPDEHGRLALRVAFPLAAPVGGEAEGIRFVLPSRLGAHESVYAMTVHKSQGSEFEHAALLLPAKRSAIATRELLYTGITRARSRFTLVAPTHAVAEATARRVSRHSGLAERLSPLREL